MSCGPGTQPSRHHCAFPKQLLCQALGRAGDTLALSSALPSGAQSEEDSHGSSVGTYGDDSPGGSCLRGGWELSRGPSPAPGWGPGQEEHLTLS